MQPNFPYYNTVDQIFHGEWSIPQLARHQFLRESIEQLWPGGHPTRLIHVAGTGGKGSTCRFLEMGLTSVGSAGAYLSPHIYDYRERFSINGNFAAREEITDIWEDLIKPHCIALARTNPHDVHTFLEISVLIALALFERHTVAWAAIETHVGGRYDWTRALDAEATVLTNVGTDHAHMLGSEQWQRVLDKVGIARKGVPLLTSETAAENLLVIQSIAEDVGAPLRLVGVEEVNALNQLLERQDAQPPVEGALINASIQRWNAALALQTIRELHPGISEAPVLDRIARTRLMGRFWQVEDGIYADIAHNVEKLEALSDEVEEQFAGSERILILGASLNRAPKALFAKLARVAKSIILTGATFKSQNPKDIYTEIAPQLPNTHIIVVADPQQALQTAKTLKSENDVILLTGSTYMIEQVLNPDPYMRHLNNSFGWRMQSKQAAQGTVQLNLPRPPSVVR